MEQFVNRGSKRTQHQWSEASKYHPDYLLKSNLAHHFVQRFWPSKGFTFLFGLYKWGCPNVPCIWGSQKIKRAMLHVGRRGPIFCQIIFYCDFWSTRKLLYFPLPVLLCLFICSSQTWHLNFSIFRDNFLRQKHLSLILFLNLDPPSRPKCDSWACGMNDFFYWWI